MIWLTNIGIIEKGRLIEIEALYVSLCGLAIIFWLSFFLQKKSPWLMWLPASVFLGLGLLAKGPTHLVFFYGIVIAVLAYWKDWRVLVHPAHFVGLVVMIGIAAAWAIPFVHATTSQVAIDKWSGQYTGRLKGIDFKFSDWIQNVPRGLIYFLPWLLLFPFARFSKLQEAKRTATGARVVMGNCSTVFGGQSCPRRAPQVQHAGNSSSIVATRHDLRRQRVAMAATLDERRTRLDQGRGRVRWAGTCDWCDRLSGYGDCVKRQAAGKKGRRGNQRARPAKRDALRRESGLSAGIFLCESTGAICERCEKSASATCATFSFEHNNEAKALAAQKWAPLRARPIARVRDYSKREMVLFEVAPANED